MDNNTHDDELFTVPAPEPEPGFRIPEPPADLKAPGIRTNVHNAKVCTVDGSDCWVASVEKAESGRQRPRILDVREFDSEQEAQGWATRRAEALRV